MHTECCAEAIKAVKALAGAAESIPGSFEERLFRVVGAHGLGEGEGGMGRNRGRVGPPGGSWLSSLVGWASQVSGTPRKWEVLVDGLSREAVKWRVPGYDVQ